MVAALWNHALADHAKNAQKVEKVAFPTCAGTKGGKGGKGGRANYLQVIKHCIAQPLCNALRAWPGAGHVDVRCGVLGRGARAESLLCRNAQREASERRASVVQVCAGVDHANAGQKKPRFRGAVMLGDLAKRFNRLHEFRLEFLRCVLAVDDFLRQTG